MPAYRKYRRTRRRRRRTRRYRRKPKMSVQKPLGDKFKFVTRYVENNFSVNPGLGGTGVHVFSANGLYDPNITGIGHQPIGFDQIMPMYDHYTVIASKISVWFQNEDSSYAQTVGIAIKDSATAISDVRRYIENGNCTYKNLSAAGDASDRCTLSKKCSIARFLGRPNSLSEDDLRGTDAANPVEQVYFHVFASPIVTSADPATVRLFAQIEYVAIMTEPKTLNLS